MANRVAELVADITKATAQINDHLKSHGISPLSIDADVPVSIQVDAGFASPRDAALQACSELQALLGGSTRSILTINAIDVANLQALCRFNIAASFPTSKPTTTYAELSDLTGISEPTMRRIVRGAMTNYVFQEKEPGKISHTAASRLLATSTFAQKWIEMFAEEIWPSLVRMVDAMEKWPDSGEPNHAGYSLANATTKHCFEHMAQDSARAERFGDAIKFFSSSPGYGPEALLDYFAVTKLTEGTLVDLGGSHGICSIPLVRKFQKLRAIVQDRPEVVKLSSKLVPEDIADRLEYMSHDFFEPQCVSADVYLLRWILHDWSDEYCLKILRALIPALLPKSRILIHELIVPEPAYPPSHMQIPGRMFDLSMKSLCNGKEREAQDWEQLVAAADARFHIRAMSQPPLSRFGIIDIEWMG